MAIGFERTVEALDLRIAAYFCEKVRITDRDYAILSIAADHWETGKPQDHVAYLAFTHSIIEGMKLVQLDDDERVHMEAQIEDMKARESMADAFVESMNPEKFLSYEYVRENGERWIAHKWKKGPQAGEWKLTWNLPYGYRSPRERGTSLLSSSKKSA